MNTSNTSKVFRINLEKETIENTDYRRVLYTSRYSQLVVMSLPAGIEIGDEVHGLDQFIRIEKGNGTGIIGGSEKFPLADGDSIVVPAGVRHNIINTGTEDLKLYTVYTPPNHIDGTLQRTKADEKEEHFDGITSLDKAA